MVAGADTGKAFSFKIPVKTHRGKKNLCRLFQVPTDTDKKSNRN